MNDDAMTAHASAAIPYVDDPAIVFRVAWYVVASSPGVYLSSYSEPESQEFQGSASFTVRAENNSMEVSISLVGQNSNIQIEAHGHDEQELGNYLETLSNEINSSLDKYRVLGTNQTSRVRQALIAKTCWDRLVFLILKKRPLSEVYYQVAHNR